MKQKLTPSDQKRLLVYQQELLQLASDVSLLVFTKSSFESQDIFVKHMSSVVKSTAKVCDDLDISYQLLESNF